MTTSSRNWLWRWRRASLRYCVCKHHPELVRNDSVVVVTDGEENWKSLQWKQTWYYQYVRDDVMWPLQRFIASFYCDVIKIKGEYLTKFTVHNVPKSYISMNLFNLQGGSDVSLVGPKHISFRIYTIQGTSFLAMMFFGYSLNPTRVEGYSHRS